MNNAAPCRGRQRIESPLKMWFVGSLSTGYGGQPTKSCRGGARELHTETGNKQDAMTQLRRKCPEYPFPQELPFIFPMVKTPVQGLFMHAHKLHHSETRRGMFAFERGPL